MFQVIVKVVATVVKAKRIATSAWLPPAGRTPTMLRKIGAEHHQEGPVGEALLQFAGRAGQAEVRWS